MSTAAISKVQTFGKYPDFLRRLKQVRPAAQTAAFISWPAIAQHIITSADVVQTFHATHQSLAGYLEADRQVAVAARRHLAERDPDAMFVYFVSPDITGHHNGFDPGVSEYRRAIEVVDGLTGMILRAIEARRTFSEEAWLVLVTSDHGGKGTHHRKGHQDKDVLTVFLIVSGSAAWPGEIKSPTYIVDAPVTALTHLGVEIDDAWGLDGKAVGLARQVIQSRMGAIEISCQSFGSSAVRRIKWMAFASNEARTPDRQPRDERPACALPGIGHTGDSSVACTPSQPAETPVSREHSRS